MGSESIFYFLKNFPTDVLCHDGLQLRVLLVGAVAVTCCATFAAPSFLRIAQTPSALLIYRVLETSVNTERKAHYWKILACFSPVVWSDSLSGLNVTPKGVSDLIVMICHRRPCWPPSWVLATLAIFLKVLAGRQGPLSQELLNHDGDGADATDRKEKKKVKTKKKKTNEASAYADLEIIKTYYDINEGWRSSKLDL